MGTSSRSPHTVAEAADACNSQAHRRRLPHCGVCQPLSVGRRVWAADCVARRVRGYTAVSDAFFPALLLHTGHAENMLWAWQMTFVLSAALSFVYLAIVVRNESLLNAKSAVASGAVLLLLPLTGATGLLVALPALLWGGLVGAVALRDDMHRKVGLTLLGFSVAATVLVLGYFSGYERSGEGSGETRLLILAWATMECLNLSFGPGLKNLPIVGMVLSAAAFIGSIFVCLRRLRYARSIIGKQEAAGLLVFIGTGLLYAAALAVGRAELVNGKYGGWPHRYALLMAPFLCAAYFAFEKFVHGMWSHRAQYTLLGAVIFTLPLNIVHGTAWVKWYNTRIEAASAEFSSGAPISDVSRRSSTNLAFDAPDLERLIPMLRDASMGPFARRTVESALPNAGRTTTIEELRSEARVTLRYCIPEAASVDLVWGVDGWKWLPSSFWPENTAIVRGAMTTRLIRKDTCHETSLRVQQGARVDFGFVITAKNPGGTGTVSLWDEAPEYSVFPKHDAKLTIRSPLMVGPDGSGVYIGGGELIPKEIQYLSDEAALVAMNWGVNGWNLLPENVRPLGSAVIDGAHQVLMSRRGNLFTATAWAPRASRMNFGFLITRKRALLERVAQAWFPERLVSTRILNKVFTAELQPTWVYDNHPDFHTEVVDRGSVRVSSRVRLAEERRENLLGSWR